MNTSVGTKARKKQPPISVKLSAKPKPSQAGPSGKLRAYLLSLENACVRILDRDYTVKSDDPECLYSQQRLMNIAKPVSLALAECNGPRRFHYHYRHRKDDESVLQPVLDDPVETLAQVCDDALKACHRELAGVHDTSLLKAVNMLERALQRFLAIYEANQDSERKE